MSWWKRSKKESIEDQIKAHIRSSPFFRKLFHMMRVPTDALDELNIKIQRLEGQFCKADADVIVLDDRLADNENFFTSHFHFVAHEMLHWLKRQREKEHYFADPEEIESFNIAIAYALSNGSSNLKETFLPLIQINIKDDNKALAFLQNRVREAKELLKKMQV